MRTFEEWWAEEGARTYCESHEDRARQAWEASREPLEIIKKHWPTVQAVIRSDIQVGEGIESVHAITDALTL